MFLRPNRRTKDGKDHTYWSLVETVRTSDGPRQRRLCYLGELNDSAQARWLKTIDVFNEQGETQQLKLFPSHVEPPGSTRIPVYIVVKPEPNPRDRDYLARNWDLLATLACANTMDTVAVPSSCNTLASRTRRPSLPH